jgi:rod shape-determining protein MreC
MAPPRNRRPGFSRRAQYTLFIGYVVAVAGSLVGAVLLALATLDPPAFGALRASVAEVTTPISTTIAGAGRGVASIPQGISDYIAVHRENQRLHKELDDAKALLMRARAISYDNRRLKTLLALRERISDPVATARLVSSSASSTRRFAVLNAGSWQGVRKGQPVRGPEGLIGQIPVRRTRDAMPALAVGRGDGLLDIKSAASATADFLPGDVFVTTGTGGVYAPNIPVAQILKRFHGDAGLARSFAQPDTLDFALVQQAYMPVAPTLPAGTTP